MVCPYFYFYYIVLLLLFIIKLWFNDAVRFCGLMITQQGVVINIYTTSMISGIDFHQFDLVVAHTAIIGYET